MSNSICNIFRAIFFHCCACKHRDAFRRRQSLLNDHLEVLSKFSLGRQAGQSRWYAIEELANNVLAIN